MTINFSRSMRLLFAYGVLTIVTCAANAQASSSAAPLTEAGEAGPPVGSATTQTRPLLEPKAIEILKATCARLAAAHSMSFTAIVTYENPSRFGFPLAYGTKSEVLLQRPDKLRVISPGDGPASEFYYDGKTMMALAPVENLVAIAAAPPTVDDMLETAYHSASVYFPFDDVIVADPYKDIAQDLRVAFYIGQSNLVGERRPMSWLMTVEGSSSKRGSVRKINCRECSARFMSMIHCNSATSCCSATGSLT